MKITQHISTKQLLKLKQTLTPKLIHMLKTFNLSYTDLLNNIQEEVKDNVVLEVLKYDQLSEYAYKRSSSYQNIMGRDISEFAVDRADKKNLYDYVLSQIEIINLGKTEYRIALSLIENINEQGFILNYSEIKEKIKKTFNVKDRKVYEVLKMVQTLEPEGVCARSLQECLLIQIEQHQFENKDLQNILNNIVKNYLTELSNKRYEYIAKKLNIETEGVKSISLFIKNNLNPNPGSSFYISNFNKIIIPSFEVKIENNEVILTNLEEKKGVHIGISDTYIQILNNPEIDKKTKEFIAEKIKKAKELIDNIKKRHENLEKLADFIIKKQKSFLHKGLIYLEPLLQKQISENLGISPSTVSRIVSSKYIHTPHGTFALKQLCPRDHFGKTSERLKLIIKDIIESSPELSDNKVSQLLKKDNINIARRTVTKYRLILGLEPSYSRIKTSRANS
ncbi:MAG: RNA polymerase factor sigma-54 [bacterium]|nr:RNA polymerase factor sigma-54 [bacterium]